MKIVFGESVFTAIGTKAVFYCLKQFLQDKIKSWVYRTAWLPFHEMFQCIKCRLLDTERQDLYKMANKAFSLLSLEIHGNVAAYLYSLQILVTKKESNGCTAQLQPLDTAGH